MAIHDLRLTDEQFYALTPRQFNELAKRFRYQQEHTELLHAITTSALVNFSVAAPKKSTTPQDFMPSMWGRASQRSKRMTDKQVAAECRAIFGGLAHASRE